MKNEAELKNLVAEDADPIADIVTAGDIGANKKDRGELRGMLREAGILFAITLIAGILLGFVYELTKEPIRIQKEKEIQEACQAVFPGAESFSPMDGYILAESVRQMLEENKVRIGTVFEAYAGDGTLEGYVVESTSSGGYGGDITIYAGITLDYVLNGISILEINETPGLGMNAQDVLVPQFAGKAVESFTYTKTGSQSESEIDAISGATKTTRAVTNAVNGALCVVREDLLGGDRNE